MELKRKCILLVRVSTDAQDLAQQTDKVKSQALSDGYTEDSIIVIEDKESAVILSQYSVVRKQVTKCHIYAVTNRNFLHAVLLLFITDFYGL